MSSITERQQEILSLLNDTFETSSSWSLIERRAFLELPIDLRRNLLSEQAKQMADYYQNDPERRELEGGTLLSTNPPNPRRGNDLQYLREPSGEMS